MTNLSSPFRVSEGETVKLVCKNRHHMEMDQDRQFQSLSFTMDDITQYPTYREGVQAHTAV